jgi:hypothetical protein
MSQKRGWHSQDDSVVKGRVRKFVQVLRRRRACPRLTECGQIDWYWAGRIVAV